MCKRLHWIKSLCYNTDKLLNVENYVQHNTPLAARVKGITCKLAANVLPNSVWEARGSHHRLA